MRLSISWHQLRRLILFASFVSRILLLASVPVAYASSGADQQSANYGLVALAVSIGAVTFAGIVGGIRYGRSHRGYEGKPRGSLRKHARPARSNLPKARDHRSKKRLRGYR